MPENYDYPLNLWDFIDETGSIITIASSNVSMDELNSILGTINIVANEDNYTLMVNGRNAGTISISSQISLKNVEYDSDTKKINFTFTTDEGDKTVSVDVSDLVDEYTAGEGLGLNTNQFFLKIDPSSEKYLSVSENGVKVSGLDTLFNNINTTLSSFGTETAKAFDTINQVLTDSINTINGGINNEIRPAIEENKNNIENLKTTVEAIKVPENVSELNNDAGYQTKDDVDVLIKIETDARVAKDTEIETALANKIEYTDVATADNPGRKAIVLKNHDVILGTTTSGQTNNLIMMSKWDKVDVGTAQNELNLNGSAQRPTYNDDKEIALLEDIKEVDLSAYATKEELASETQSRTSADDQIQKSLADESVARVAGDATLQGQIDNVNNRFETIKLTKNSDLQYSLMIGDAIAGTIDIPKDQFLKTVSYDETSKVITFVFETTDGEKTSTINVSDLIDTYVAGNGLKLENNQFSINLSADTQAYIEVSENGIKIVGIDEALAKKVDWTDISTQDNPNRKSIILNNHDTILGNTTNGTSVNIAMVSKWDKVDLGSAQVSINLNGKDARPTYNDDKEIALLEDVQGLGATIVLEKTNDLQYTLKVGDAIVGTIDIPKDQFVKSVSYNEETKTIDFIFETIDGEQTVNVNVADLVDTYTAGNGISLASNEFSIKIDATTQQYIEVSTGGLKIVNIDEKLAEKVGLVDIATEENPNRKAIVLKNHDTILGTTTEGATQNLIMMSKWNKVDVGTASNELNLNGSAEHPTYNDEKELAFVDEIPSVEGLASEEWVNAQGFLKEHQDISHLVEKADLDAEIENRSAADTQLQADLESEAEARKIADDEIKLELENKVEYTDASDEENPNRKTIQLNNHDSISGLDTSGVGYNLVMVSKWNKADFGTSSLPINLNGSEERPTYNDDEEIALMKDIEEIKLPIEFNFPIRTLQDKVYTQEEIFTWFGVADVAELKGLIVREGQFYLKYGIQLSGNPYYYKMPIQYIAFESANQIKMVVIGLDTTNDMPTKYEIILNLDGTIAEGNSNIKVTSSDLAFATDMPSLDGYATEEWVNTQGFLKEHQDISNLATKDEVALKANQSDVVLQVNALNERIDAITVPTKVSELENDAQYQTASDVDARIQSVVGAAPEALNTLEEIANKLADNDDVVAALTTQIAEKATTEALNAEIGARTAKDTEIEAELANKVAYTDVTTEENPNRKAIVLNNHDTLLGYTTSGSAVNIAMVSKWDKVDLGSTQVSINLNGSEERPTYNDDAQLALLSDVEAVTVPTKVSELENDAQYQTKSDVDTAIASKAEKTEVDEIKADLEQFKAPYEIDLNALNSAGDADSEAISTAIGGIDNLRAVISENRSIIGDINNGTVPVSIRILGNITTVYYVLDSLAGYTLNEINIQNTSGTLAKNSVIHSVMSEEMVVDNLTSNESTLPLSAKQGKVLDEKIQKKGMYYQGVKVDTQKLFALTKESTEDDIKAALQLETSSGSYTLPTAEILDDCLGKGYQLLSNWMPVSVAWNGAAYVLYTVGQSYMMKPTGLYTVSIKITDGVYSVFQAAKVEEFAIISKINTQIESLYQTVNNLKSNIPILSAKVELLESKVDNLEKSNSEVVETYDGSQELNDEAKVYSISNANITNSPSITAKSVILNDSTLTNNARMQIKAENVNINNLQVTGDFPKSTSNSVININDTENIIFKDMTFNSSNVYNGIEIGLSSDNSKLPKNIIFDNCRFEGSFSNNAILIFGTQNNATITLNNCYFEKVSNALRLSNKSNASGVTVNIINCTVDEWDSNTLWSGFLICEDYTNTESEAQAEEANLFSPEKIKVNFINLIHNSEKILPSDIVSVCGSKDENQVVVVCIDAIQGSDYCINYDANKFPTITFE